MRSDQKNRPRRGRSVGALTASCGGGGIAADLAAARPVLVLFGQRPCVLCRVNLDVIQVLLLIPTPVGGL
jgi:hypothetical protein